MSGTPDPWYKIRPFNHKVTKEANPKSLKVSYCCWLKRTRTCVKRYLSEWFDGLLNFKTTSWELRLHYCGRKINRGDFIWSPSFISSEFAQPFNLITSGAYLISRQSSHVDSDASEAHPKSRQSSHRPSNKIASWDHLQSRQSSHRPKAAGRQAKGLELWIASWAHLQRRQSSHRPTAAGRPDGQRPLLNSILHLEPHLQRR